MTKLVKVDGMMCHHCEMHVENALSAIDGVLSAKADHEKGEVIIEMGKEVDSSLLKAAIEKEGYSVRSI